MCLDAHAHGVRIEHPIFNTPNKVSLTFTDRPTPPSYAGYPEGRDLGETMSMWRVQTEGYTTHEGQLIGVVSRNAGFLDSPDAEWISGGVNSKGPRAVALGRHGNFFHWGFAASPTFMTDEAKDVFVNAVHYISGFDGQAPIARKKSGTMMRSALEDAIESMGDEGYALTQARYAGYRADHEATVAALRARKEAGETLNRMEESQLGMAPPVTPGRLARAERFLSLEQLEALERNPSRVAQYLRSVRPFMRPSGWYTLTVDEELMDFGVGNADPNMIGTLIAAFGTDREPGARRLLERYTDEAFLDRKGWLQWHESNRHRLFFTEAGGYRWLVNTVGEASDEGATKDAPAAPSKASQRAKASPKSPLAAVLTAKPLGADEYALHVQVDVLEGWHAYSSVPANSAYRPLTFTWDLPEGVKLVGQWEAPVAHASEEAPGLGLWSGLLDFRGRVRATGLTEAAEITCTLGYQVCDERMCLPPTELAVRATLQPK